MSQKPLRGRSPLNRRTIPSSSTTQKRRRRVIVSRRSKEKRLKRCKSEPALSTVNLSGDVDADVEDHDGLLAQRQLCTDGFASAQELMLPSSLPKIEGYNKDGKVVVNVTVEGSPGPIRTMIKLGSSVEETIEIVKKQYNSEGRTPQLHLSTFELHQSSFSLQCLNKTDMIGDLGRRSFYMRKCDNHNSIIGSDIILTKGENCEPQNPILVFHAFIYGSFKKLVKLSSNLCKLMGCIDR